MDGTKTPGKDRPPKVCGCMDNMTMAAYLDGMLSTPQREVCERHFAVCAECRKALAELSELLRPERIVVPSAVKDRARKLVLSTKEEHNIEEIKPAQGKHYSRLLPSMNGARHDVLAAVLPPYGSLCRIA